MRDSPCIDQIGESRCTGCFGCEAACARGAIEVTLDRDGFYKPTVARERCNECGLCARRCPVLDVPDSSRVNAWRRPRAFAAWSGDAATRTAASSGGVFPELARRIIASGGAVVGCVWGRDWAPEHLIARDGADLERMRGSKYVPSNLGSTYREVGRLAREAAGAVLFSGAPCQVAAMDRALSAAERQRVLLIEVLCHGVPSLRVFRRYLAELFPGGEVASYTFRDKSLGWQTVFAQSEDGRSYRQPMTTDGFGRGFAIENLYLMEACYACPFADAPRSGDLTIGDFWGCPPEWTDARGVSVVLANTPLGLRELEAAGASGALTLHETELEGAVAHNRFGPSSKYRIPRGRRPFLDAIAMGASFGEVSARHFPGRWAGLWRSFRESRSKPKMVVEVVRDQVRRLLRGLTE